AGLFARLEAMGHHPAVLIRGYRARRREPGDEACELVELTNSQRVVQGRDRVASGEQAIERLGADVLLLDDGFQHRRLHRDLDIVLIDCTNPFGYGHLLPRGLLREPISSLMRADLLVLTRADLVGAEGLKSLHSEMAALAPGKPVIEARHRPVGLEALNAPAPELRGGLSGRAVVCFAGIGNAEAFRATAVSLGSNVVACRWWPDHHRYQPADAAELCQLADRCGAEVLLTSYKDLLKLRRLRVDWTRPVLALRIGIDLRPDGDTILTGLLRQVLGHG
ncbi:MAG: tetraacyldisaccharide 4'-kinase, partial [Phycisphaerae bacterium]